jgi:hypothetical protein
MPKSGRVSSKNAFPRQVANNQIGRNSLSMRSMGYSTLNCGLNLETFEWYCT